MELVGKEGQLSRKPSVDRFEEVASLCVGTPTHRGGPPMPLHRGVDSHTDRKPCFLGSISDTAVVLRTVANICLLARKLEESLGLLLLAPPVLWGRYHGQCFPLLGIKAIP